MSVKDYSFGPLSTRGVFAGLRLGQIGLLLGVLVAAASVFALRSDVLGFTASLLLGGLGLLAAFVTPGGRGVDQWVPIVARWVVVPKRHLDPMPLLGQTRDGCPQATPPPTLKKLAVLPAELAGRGNIGVIKDAAAGTWTAVLAARGGMFPLLSPVQKTAKVGQWGKLLVDLARASSPVARLQWIERTAPDDGGTLRRDLAARGAVAGDDPALASYAGLLADAQPVTQEHEILLAVQISTRSAARAVKRAGGGDDGACTVLLRELELLAETLARAGVKVDGALTPGLVAKAIRTAFDPSTRAAFARFAEAAPERDGIHPHQTWPLATDLRWGAYRTDGAVHATYWIAEWPRVPVGPDFLEPLLLTTHAVRTVTVVMQPGNPIKAQREVEHALTDRDANDAVRARYGFAGKFRQVLEREADERRREELAVGHGEYRFAGYVTVTAAGFDELEDACAEVEQRAQQSSLELHRLYGQQDQAFTYTLPLARGLR